MKKSNPLTCAASEDLLIRQQAVDLNKEQKEKLTQHLQHCPLCQQFQKLLATMSQSMKIREQSALKPDPAIRRSIIRKIKRTRIEQTTFLQVTLSMLRKLLQYRIPVYQAILGMLLVSLIIWGSVKFPFWKQQNFRNSHHLTQEVNDEGKQIEMLNCLDILEPQKVGTSVSEDTMLIKFFSPAM